MYMFILFPLFWYCFVTLKFSFYRHESCCIGRCSWNWTTNRCWGFARYVKELWIDVLLYTARDLLKTYINRWRGWLWGGGGEGWVHHQVWWCVKLLIQLVREMLHLSRKSNGILETSGCGNHVPILQYIWHEIVELTMVRFKTCV